MLLSWPAAQPFIASTKSTAPGRLFAGIGCDVQVAPPSAVPNIWPVFDDVAVAHPCDASTNQTPPRLLTPAGGDCDVQLRPPSEVVMIAPTFPVPVPTAQPFVALMKCTLNGAPMPAGIGLMPQVAPPSIVARAIPAAAGPPPWLKPTAQP